MKTNQFFSIGGIERFPLFSDEGQISLIPQVEHDGPTARQTCCPNPTNNPLISDLWAKIRTKPRKGAGAGVGAGDEQQNIIMRTQMRAGENLKEVLHQYIALV